MPEYINRDTLCKYYQDRFEFLKNKSYTAVNGGYRINDEIQAGAAIASEFLAKARQAPAVDVVEVVRCKDCRFRKTRNCVFTSVDQYGDLIDLTENDDFCSNGERKCRNDGQDH